jgi:hypothetical protein
MQCPEIEDHMAFHASHTFQKNRRFWMAAVLMICMVSFVFCTGMKGDMAERFGHLFGSRGSPVAVVGGYNVTSRDLYNLKTQRNVANEFMRNCTEIAFKKISKVAYEEDRRKDDKNVQARARARAQLLNIQSTLYERKSRSRYFDMGVKFDDLLEFKLWQATADKLGIQLDTKNVIGLLHRELYSNDPRSPLLEEGDFGNAHREVRRNFQNIDEAYVIRALTEEFRVRIAQEAVLLAQPFQAFTRREQQDSGMKFAFAEVPDEIRAPLTLAQLWEAYKAKRAEFDVNLIPVHVEDFLKEINDEPNDLQRAEFFKTHKDKPADPGAEDRGLQLPMRVKIDYVMADPTSKEYLGLARVVELLKTTNPIHLDVVQSPLCAAVSAMAVGQQHRIDVENQYQISTRPSDKFDYRATPLDLPGAACPIMTWLAKRHPEAAASMIGSGFSGPANDMGALASYMAWGALKHPHVLEASLKAESERRAAYYAPIVANAAADPWTTVVPFFLLDLAVPPQRLPVEAVQHEIQEIIAKRTAEEWAHENMQTLRTALEKADGNEHKYRRALNELVPKLNLIYGPAKKDVYLSRYSVDDAKELAPLKESYLKYTDLINFFEARDVTPERLLKPGDFHKLFFDSSESFAATSPYHAMPWPPKAKPSTTRMWKPEDPRLIDRKQIGEKDWMNFQQQLSQNDPLKPVPDLDLFKDAEKPILFWRTGERIPERPGEYADIERNLKKYQADWIKAGEQAKKMEGVSAKLNELRKKQAELKKAKDKDAELKQITEEANGLSSQLGKMEKEAQGSASSLRDRQIDLKDKEADLEEIKRLLVEGWRFERARTEKALPRAESIALELINNLQKTKLEIADAESAKLQRQRIALAGLAPMHPEKLADQTIDYFKPPLPKDKIPFARNDMMDEAVHLYNLKDPIKIDNKALDDLNKMLFDKTRNNKKNPAGEYVQILTNKPRTVFYVAVVTTPPFANPARFGLRPGIVDDDNIVIRGIYSALEDPGPMRRRFLRDHFAERIQQQDATAFRANVVAYLGRTLGFDVLKEDAKKDFDDRGGGD